MAMLFLAILFVVLIPVAEGGLLALVLREIHLRNPEPIGQILIPEDAEPLESDADAKQEIAEPNPETQSENQRGFLEEVTAIGHISAGTLDALSPQSGRDTNNGEEQHAPTEAASVFDNAAEVPADLPFTDEINAMLGATPLNAPDDLESIIEQNDVSESETFQELEQKANEEKHQIENETDDIEQLRSEIPTEKIDFAMEFAQGGDNNSNEDSYSVVQDVLGKDFDVDSLVQENPSEATTAEDVKSADDNLMLDVREPELGLVQVSSLPSNAGETFVASETIVPDYSDGWIQELNSRTDDSVSEADAAQFCFTEESRPMLTKKRRTK